jgi:hypothetical protein
MSSQRMMQAGAMQDGATSTKCIHVKACWGEQPRACDKATCHHLPKDCHSIPMTTRLRPIAWKRPCRRLLHVCLSAHL